jgi:plasmid stability protein
MNPRALALTATTAGEERGMATLTIRGLDDEVHRRLRVRAAENGRSMEAEVRAVLEAAVAAGSSDAVPWVDRVRERFSEVDPALAAQWHERVTRPRDDWAVSPGEVAASATRR